MNNHNDLFQLALGITSPWFVSGSLFDQTKKRLDIKVDFKPGSRFACPECKAEGCPVHDTIEKTWRHLDFFQHQAFLTARTPRARRVSPATPAACALSMCRGRA